MLKVAINSLPLKDENSKRGVGFYTKYLIESLKKNEELEVTEYADLAQVKEADIVHIPFFDLFYRTLIFNKKWPTVVTIHDVTPLRFSEHYPPGIKGQLNLEWQKFVLKGIDEVITDSFASKKDIATFLNVKEDKINPFYLSYAEHFKKVKELNLLLKTQEKYKLPEKFALFAGSVNWNKNILNMAQACIENNLDLVLVGNSFLNKDPINHPELQSFKLFLEKYAGNQKIHILGFVEDLELVNIYNLASVYMAVSFYEGFGMTILEAQACGVPVITSSVSSMPEVAGKAAFFVDPDSVGEIKNALNKIMTDKELAQKLIYLGFENIKNFSWAKTASQTVKVYEKVLGFI